MLLYKKNKSSHESKSSGITILKRDKRIFSAECLGIIDTGNALSEPISGLPVIVLGAKRHSEFAQAANVPIPMRTAAGESLLFGLKPKKLLINGCPVEAILAVGAKLQDIRELPASTLYSAAARMKREGLLVRETDYELEDPFFALWIRGSIQESAIGLNGK